MIWLPAALLHSPSEKFGWAKPQYGADLQGTAFRGKDLRLIP